MSRKRTLVEHGFRLPSAMDNRPLKLGGVRRPDRPDGLPVGDARARTSWAAPAASSSSRSSGRPAWSTRRSWSSRPRARSTTWCTRSGVRAERDERVLVTTLTKKMAEDLTDYLLELGIRVRYLHSEVDTLRRVELLRELRLGEFDVLVGINLLREGLDLPEVSLVAILDADKEGFLRSGTSLIQTIGRAARNVSGQVHMYADKITAVDGAGDRRDQPAAREAGRLQRGARHRPAAAAQEDRRHPRAGVRARPRTPSGRRSVGGSGRQQSRGARRRGPEPGARPAPGVYAGHEHGGHGRAPSWPT